MKRFVLLAVISMFVLVAARPSIRGYPVGSVTEVDRKAGVVQVDLGSKDGVFKGIAFVVVDEKGHKRAGLTANEVYDNLFWSDKVAPAALADIGPGMQVRWVLTPEVTSLVEARKLGEVSAYRKFIKVFPDSRFTPDLISSLPENKLRELDPEYYEAWKKYTKDSFKDYIKAHPHTGFARAAAKEVASIESYEKDREKEVQERTKRAEDAEALRKKQEALDEKIKAQTEKTFPGRELLGKLVNNSASPVRFAFDPPSEQQPVTVPPNDVYDMRLPQGTINYKVYNVETGAFLPAPGETPKPIKEGSADLQFDLWQIAYP